MTELYNISEWNIKSWLATGGTRAKCFLENPTDGKEYFFKESIERYNSEFWSEIIASKIGKHLGFNLLDYNIGVIKDTVGCICESMIALKTEELEHGINLIKNSVSGFKVSDRPIILFSDVETSFLNYKGFIHNFIDMLVFDSIIGNQDRHSENWAIIRSLDTSDEKFNTRKVTHRMRDLYRRSGFKLKNVPFKKFFLRYMNKAELINIEFSPIYDSGSSLGREIPEERLQDFLDDERKIEKYIKNGKSEIRWEVGDKKINHFEILTRIIKIYPNQVQKTVSEVIKKYNKNDIQDIIRHVDDRIPEELAESKLSLQRKELIIKFIDLRISKLKLVRGEV